MYMYIQLHIRIYIYITVDTHIYIYIYVCVLYLRHVDEITGKAWNKARVPQDLQADSME